MAHVIFVFNLNQNLIKFNHFITVRCVQPEGLFKDPLDKARYIHCIKGEPHSMICPDEMVWDDSMKSCFGQGT